MSATTLQPISWPPPYKVRKHRAARSVKLKASAASGLVIITPYRFNLRYVTDILEENRDWIIKQLQKFPRIKRDVLPDTIYLRALDENWRIEYQLCATKAILIERPQKELVLVGNIDDQAYCKHLLIKWLKQRAKKYLVTRLEQVSQAIGLSYTKTTIRSQNTMWGSCTFDKAISLNYKLIFLPTTLMTHVMIHELCHTKYLNHSERFWQLVASFDPQWRVNRSDLRKADIYMPEWL